MIVLVIDGVSVLPNELERHPPIPAHRHRPCALPVTLERMKGQSGKCHISWGSGGAQATQDRTQPFGVLRPDASRGASREELGKPLVFESTTMKWVL